MATLATCVNDLQAKCCSTSLSVQREPDLAVICEMNTISWHSRHMKKQETGSHGLLTTPEPSTGPHGCSFTCLLGKHHTGNGLGHLGKKKSSNATSQELDSIPHLLQHHYISILNQTLRYRVMMDGWVDDGWERAAIRTDRSRIPGSCC